MVAQDGVTVRRAILALAVALAGFLPVPAVLVAPAPRPHASPNQTLAAWIETPGRLLISSILLAGGLAACVAVAAAVLLVVGERSRALATIGSAMMAIGSVAAFGGIVEYVALFRLSAQYVRTGGEQQAATGLLDLAEHSWVVRGLWVAGGLLLIGLLLGGVALLHARAVPVWSALAMCAIPVVLWTGHSRLLSLAAGSLALAAVLPLALAMLFSPLLPAAASVHRRTTDATGGASHR